MLALVPTFVPTFCEGLVKVWCLFACAPNKEREAGRPCDRFLLMDLMDKVIAEYRQDIDLGRTQMTASRQDFFVRLRAWVRYETDFMLSLAVGKGSAARATAIGYAKGMHACEADLEYVAIYELRGASMKRICQRLDGYVAAWASPDEQTQGRLEEIFGADIPRAKGFRIGYLAVVQHVERNF